ncbi:MAG: DUF3460 family protein [Brachymonas sp.]|nr:DUF3460 family protein [Brachymonas sp.]
MMQWLGGTDYQSDITQFLEQLKQQDPNLPARQKQGHALLWQPQLPDAAESRSLQKGFAAAHIAQQPYVYATQPLNPAKKPA